MEFTIVDLESFDTLDGEPAIAIRSSARDIGITAFCHGSPAGMNSTRSSPAANRAVSPAWRWAMWIGSKVPPRIPVRTPASIGRGGVTR